MEEEECDEEKGPEDGPGADENGLREDVLAV